MRIKRLCNAKKGFSLIEVIIALAILMIVVLGLISSYYSYYRNVTDLRIQTIGQNLAQLQLEDLRNISFNSFDNIFKGFRYNPNYNCPNYPPAEVFIYSGSTGYSFYKRLELGPIAYGNLPDWEDIDNPISVTSDSLTVTIDGESVSYGEGEILSYFQNNSSELASITYSEIDGEYVPVIYNSGKRDSCFIIEGLSEPPDDLMLPDSIGIIARDDGKYDLIIEKWTFPFYKKEITIEDLTPEISAGDDLPKKLYEVSVTIFWTVNGVEKSTTVRQEVSFEGQI